MFSFITAALGLMFCLGHARSFDAIFSAPHPGDFEGRVRINFFFLLLPGILLFALSILHSFFPQDIVWLWYCEVVVLLILTIPASLMSLFFILDAALPYFPSKPKRKVVYCTSCHFVQRVEYSGSRCSNCNSRRKLKLRMARPNSDLLHPATWLPRSRWELNELEEDSLDWMKFLYHLEP